MGSLINLLNDNALPDLQKKIIFISNFMLFKTIFVCSAEIKVWANWENSNFLCSILALVVLSSMLPLVWDAQCVSGKIFQFVSQEQL